MSNAARIDSDAKIMDELIQSSCISEEQARHIRNQMEKKDISLMGALAALNLDSEPAITETIARILDIAYIDVDNFEVNRSDLDLISRETAHRYKVLPLFRMSDSLMLGMADPTNTIAIDSVKEESSLDVEPCLVSREGLERILNRYYPEPKNLLSSIVDDFDISDFQIFEQENAAAPDVADMGPVARAFSEILTRAVRERVSDIHIEPVKKAVLIRYRIDGILHDVSELPVHITKPLVSHIKVLCSLQITETRRPLDGRYQATIDDREIDMRVSIIPTVFGESVVIRLLGADNFINRIHDLGFSRENLDAIDTVLKNPWGLMLASGPTGSGKTTTLFALLEKIKTREKKIITIEDPVEYKLEDIRQINVNQKVDLTFATGLRAVLRQDPDIVLVGEIRDSETASISTQAALTGHLVLSTLHTNDAASAVVRLLDMGVDSYLIASSLSGVVGQRLVRRICPYCIEESPQDREKMERRGIQLSPEETPKVGWGCSKCFNTGYIGRIAIAEVLVVTQEIRNLIMARSSAEEIASVARSQGMNTLTEAGIRNIATGMTTFSEVVRTVGLD